MALKFTVHVVQSFIKGHRKSTMKHSRDITNRLCFLPVTATHACSHRVSFLPVTATHACSHGVSFLPVTATHACSHEASMMYVHAYPDEASWLINVCTCMCMFPMKHHGLSMSMFYSQEFAISAVFVALAFASYNGASFYIDVFSRKYNSKSN